MLCLYRWLDGILQPPYTWLSVAPIECAASGYRESDKYDSAAIVVAEDQLEPFLQALPPLCDNQLKNASPFSSVKPNPNETLGDILSLSTSARAGMGVRTLIGSLLFLPLVWATC